jgi:ABC-type lipoprotein export system ATPase subunit
LDEDNGAEIFRILAAYRDQGGTLLIVSHGPEGRQHADRIVALRDGQLIDTGGS